MTELCKIMNKYKSDKSWHHNYTKIYDLVFNDLKNDCMNVLEIGIGSIDENVSSSMNSKQMNMLYNKYDIQNYKPGASLRGWKEYFKNSNIYGLDIDKKAMVKSERIKTNVVDSTDSNQVNNYLKNNSCNSFDIIIDDGLHTSDAQIATLINFFSCLKSGGLYIIEDLYNSRGKWIPEKVVDSIFRLIDDGFIEMENPGDIEIYTGYDGIIKPRNSNILVIKKK